jgi:hypothetical protein
LAGRLTAALASGSSSYNDGKSQTLEQVREHKQVQKHQQLHKHVA